MLYPSFLLQILFCSFFFISTSSLDIRLDKFSSPLLNKSYEGMLVIGVSLILLHFIQRCVGFRLSPIHTVCACMVVSLLAFLNIQARLREVSVASRSRDPSADLQFYILHLQDFQAYKKLHVEMMNKRLKGKREKRQKEQEAEEKDKMK